LKKPVALVDLSHFLHTFRRSSRYSHMSRVVQGVTALGNVSDWIRVPTGHVFGTVKVVWELSQHFQAVILAVDSKSPYRYEALPEYKSGRRTPTGDPFEDYSVYEDLKNILAICTARPNVHYCKVDGMEADDIIASLIKGSPEANWDLHCYFNDVDLLQTPGTYRWFSRPGSPEVVRAGYLYEKFKWEGDYLPLPYKVIKGDASDNIPSLIPRLRSAEVLKICRKWVEEGSHTSNGHILGAMMGYTWSGAFAWVATALCDVDSDLYRALDRNFKVVCPQYVDWRTLPLKQLGYTVGAVNSLLETHYGFPAEDFYFPA